MFSTFARRLWPAAIPLLLVAVAACGAGDPNADGHSTRIGVTVYDMSSFVSQGQRDGGLRRGERHRTPVELRQR